MCHAKIHTTHMQTIHNYTRDYTPILSPTENPFMLGNWNRRLSLYNELMNTNISKWSKKPNSFCIYSARSDCLGLLVRRSHPSPSHTLTCWHTPVSLPIRKHLISSFRCPLLKDWKSHMLKNLHICLFMLDAPHVCHLPDSDRANKLPWGNCPYELCNTLSTQLEEWIVLL